MMLITFTDGKPVMRDGMIGSEQSCCCGNGCECPMTLDNCTLTITYTGGTVPSPDPVSPVPISQLSNTVASGCGYAIGQDTLQFCNFPLTVSAGGIAIVTCEQCCLVEDSEGRVPGDGGYVPTHHGVGCTVDFTLVLPTQQQCDAPGCADACDNLPTDITVAIDCDPACGNEFP